MRPESEAEFTDFVAEQGDALLRYARLLFADAHEAEDGLQIALVRVVRNWQSAEASPAAYTRTALRNLAIDGSRRRQLIPVPSDEAPEGIPTPDLADSHAAAASLDAMLSRLPAKQRVTVVLRVVDGLSEAETAQLMGCAAGTVKSNLSRALAVLRRELSSEQRPERATP